MAVKTQPKTADLTETIRASDVGEVTADELDVILAGNVDLAGFGEELADIDVSGYDLSQTQELDIRTLRHRAWYAAEIVSCQPGTSGSGNPQWNLVLRVIEPSEKAERDAEGAPVVGVTVFDQAATPRPPLDAKKLQSLWKLKSIARAAGLAELGPNGEVRRIKPGTKAADFVGCRLRFRNTVDEKYDPSNPRNKPDAYLPLG